MKAKRKPVLMDVWLNEEGKEKMPLWVQNIAESGAAPGKTFLIQQPNKERRLIPTGYYMIMGPEDVYPCDPNSFKQLYEVQEEGK